MISIEHLHRCYGDLTAVDDVSLSIERGEIVGLLGHNGAGKTTLMKILTGFLEPSGGRVSVGGCDVVAERAGVQRQIGYLPENAPLYPEMLVQEYLRMIAELRGIETERIDAAVARAVVATGLAERVTQPIGTLSKGFRQRVGLAQAIVHEPDVLVLDEPTNGLDPVQIQSIRQLIRELGRSSTVILSTHILQEIEAVCERVLVMIDGSLVADAPMRELLETHAVSISLAEGAADAEATLRGVEGVRAVRSLGPDRQNPGFTAWRVECEPGRSRSAALLAASQQAGIAVAAAMPEQPTLESVFNRLQDEHVAKRHAGAAS